MKNKTKSERGIQSASVILASGISEKRRSLSVSVKKRKLRLTRAPRSRNRTSLAPCSHNRTSLAPCSHNRIVAIAWWQSHGRNHRIAFTGSQSHGVELSPVDSEQSALSIGCLISDSCLISVTSAYPSLRYW